MAVAPPTPRTPLLTPMATPTNWSQLFMGPGRFGLMGAGGLPTAALGGALPTGPLPIGGPMGAPASSPMGPPLPTGAGQFTGGYGGGYLAPYNPVTPMPPITPYRPPASAFAGTPTGAQPLPGWSPQMQQRFAALQAAFPGRTPDAAIFERRMLERGLRPLGGGFEGGGPRRAGTEGFGGGIW